MSHDQFVPPRLPFDVSFSKFCDYLANPGILVKDFQIVQYYIDNMLPQIEKDMALFKKTKSSLGRLVN